jgi:hypothetical protein
MSILKTIELHDALLKGMNIDYISKRVTVELDLYEDSHDSHRKSASIIFEGVKSISEICNLDRLQDNAKAGNVNYWVPDQSNGTSYIYLVDGCLAILAKTVEVILHDSTR